MTALTAADIAELLFRLLRLRVMGEQEDES